MELPNVDLKALTMSAENIIHRLHDRNMSSMINHFMFGFDLAFADDVFNTREKLLDELHDIAHNLEIHTFGESIVITNKNCSMSGWRNLVYRNGSFIDERWC